MNNSNNNMQIVKSGSSNNGDEYIVKILHNLGQRFAGMSKDVDLSLEMLTSCQIDTALTTKIKNAVKDPINEMAEMGQTLNSVYFSVLDNIIKAYFTVRKDLIEKAVSKPKGNDIYYYIVLKDDTSENRHAMFAFLRWYDTERISELFPLHFQFIPKSVQHKIVGNEITLAE